MAHAVMKMTAHGVEPPCDGCGRPRERGSQTRPRALDLFCKAGGAAMGLYQAGFDVVGVDIEDQPRYPFEFFQCDALSFLDAGGAEGFDFIWASPPCQRYTSLRSMPNARNDHPDLVAPTRERLRDSGLPYTIENVGGAPLLSGSIMLCGTMFGLGVKEANAELRRHRFFECSFAILTPACRHSRQVVGVYGGDGPHYDRPPRRPKTVGVWGSAGGYSHRDGAQQFSTTERSEAMGIRWMTGKELSQAIPPAYSEYIGRQVIDILERRGLTPRGGTR